MSADMGALGYIDVNISIHLSEPLVIKREVHILIHDLLLLQGFL